MGQILIALLASFGCILCVYNHHCLCLYHIAKRGDGFDHSQKCERGKLFCLEF